MRGGGLTDREHQLLVDIAKAQQALLYEADMRTKAAYLGRPLDQHQLSQIMTTITIAEANLEYDLKAMGKL